MTTGIIRIHRKKTSIGGLVFGFFFYLTLWSIVALPYHWLMLWLFH